MSFPSKAKDRYYSVKNGPEVEVRDGRSHLGRVLPYLGRITSWVNLS
jgi:hypothetical protein